MYISLSLLNRELPIGGKDACNHAFLPSITRITPPRLYDAGQVLRSTLPYAGVVSAFQPLPPIGSSWFVLSCLASVTRVLLHPAIRSSGVLIAIILSLCESYLASRA